MWIKQLEPEVRPEQILGSSQKKPYKYNECKKYFAINLQHISLTSGNDLCVGTFYKALLSENLYRKKLYECNGSGKKHYLKGKL